MSNTMLAGLYLLTSDALFDEQNWERKIELALKAGVKLLQYRNKTTAFEKQVTQAKQLLTLCKAYHASLIINDDPALAAEIGADGVHLGQLDLQKYSIPKIKKQLPIDSIVGVSCYNDLNLAKKAEAQGADYVSFGRFFSSKTKPQAPSANISTLIKAKKVLSIPIAAIGGITLQNAPLLLQKADMLAVCGGIWDNPDIVSAVQAFKSLFKNTP